MTKSMVHPGPPSPHRHLAVPGHLSAIRGTLRRGQTVMQAVADLFAAHEYYGGVLSLGGLCCDPMRFVLPALSQDGVHAAWYSDTHAPSSAVHIQSATAIVGWRDGARFLHCHGIWQGQDGAYAMGHLLPFDSVIAEDIEVSGLGSPDAGFVARPDPETAFTLFGPEPRPHGWGIEPQSAGETELQSNAERHHLSQPQQSPMALFVRLFPGEDVITAIEQIAAQHQIVDAELHGIGSIDHVRFADGRRMDCLATELRLTRASIRAGKAQIEIDVVDIHGTIASGEILRGANPVGVTLELLIAPIPLCAT